MMSTFTSTQIAYLLGFAVVFSYAIVSYSKKSPAQLSDAVLLFLASTSIPPCIRVIVVFYKYNSNNVVQELSEAEHNYIMIGALAVIWLSCNEIVKKFRDKITGNL